MMNNSIKKLVNGCDITIAFSEDKNPKLKNNVLWYLSQCYEDRVSKEIDVNCTLICGRFKRFKGLILSRQVVLFLKDKLLLLCIQNIHLVKALPTPIDTFHCCNNQSIY